MPPIVSIIGKSRSGKTALIEDLIGELKSRGYRVATIKHAPQGMTFDESDKDSWRHIQAGSEATVISSRDKMVLVKPLAVEITLDEIVALLGEDYDIILAEGFKAENAPKIEVHRREAGPPPGNISRLVALVTDEPLETETRRFSRQDITGLADFVAENFIEPRRGRIAVYVNGAPVSLGAFPREIIANTLVAMVSSLKGVGEVRSLKVLMRRKPESSL